MAFKFNNGNGAIICDSCGVILKTHVIRRTHDEEGQLVSAVEVPIEEYDAPTSGIDSCKKCAGKPARKLKKVA